MIRQHHWLNGHEFEQILKHREAWHAAFHGVAKSGTWLSDGTTTWLFVMRWQHLHMRVHVCLHAHLMTGTAATLSMEVVEWYPQFPLDTLLAVQGCSSLLPAATHVSPPTEQSWFWLQKEPGTHILWRFFSQWLGSGGKDLLDSCRPELLKLTMHISSLRTLLKGRFWFFRSGIGPKILHF